MCAAQPIPEAVTPEPLVDYALRSTSPLPPLLAELLATTRERLGRRVLWANGPSEALFLQMLTRSLGARRILEIGTFTGFSALLMASALPDDGELITCDVDPECIGIARSFFARSPDGRKITIRQGPALDTLKTLSGPFELIFVDADKENYVGYFEAALPLLAPNGLMLVDNVLWRGRVLHPESEEDHAIVAFAEHVQRDARVTNVMLTTGDGVMVIQHR
jgi:caffeoyl-CoA O-methyltransferase